MQKAWVQAKNVEHLNAIFHKSKNKARTEAFTSWIGAVGSGSATILTYEGQKAERERILTLQPRHTTGGTAADGPAGTGVAEGGGSAGPAGDPQVVV